MSACMPDKIPASARRPASQFADNSLFRTKIVRLNYFGKLLNNQIER